MSVNTVEELTCKPIDTLPELMMYVKDLPPWRSLCQELTPHSDYKINNRDINKHSDVYLDEPETFCHLDPDKEDPPRYEKTNLPKTLVCHDMANGYHDDSFIDGTEERNAYTFYNWAGIDIFCYFSHHLVTIPPLSWINAGHAHGVKVIGTLITEWNEGVQFWENVLESETMFQSTAGALVAIAKSLKFDGWLLNVENKIAKPKLLLEFVQHLRFLLHEEIPNSVLIWYDSVTIEGHLNWQNALNDKNKPFFDACDGIFTNYSWTEFDITTSAIEAGDRITDLYIGIDVWGRNFYGGGQFNTQAAIKVAHEEGCSLAIFAPAWTHEAMSTESEDPNYITMAEELDKGQQFLLRDRALWGSFWPYLYTSLPCTLPFKTSFCQGLGKKRRMYGEVVGDRPWFNLRQQQYQPSAAHGPHGYLLSSAAAVRAASARALFRDNAGILRVQEHFQASRIELFSVKPKTSEPAPRDSDDYEPERDPQNIEVSTIDRRAIDETSVEPPPAFVLQPEPSDKPETNTESPELRSAMRQKPARKRTIKECLKEFFKTKSEKRKVSVSESERSAVKQPAPESTALVPKKMPRGMEPELAAGSSGCMPSSGKSMQTISLNLRLGQASAGPRPVVALAAVPLERECLERYQEDSFIGGSCVRVHPADAVVPAHRYTRLLHCDFAVGDALLVCLATKPLPDFPDQYLSVYLHTVSETGVVTRVVLVGSDTAPRAARARELALPPLAPAGARFKEVQRYLLLHQTGFYVPIENYFGWNVRYYEVSQLAGSRVTSVNLRAGLDYGHILLGHFGICHLPAAAAPAPL